MLICQCNKQIKPIILGPTPNNKSNRPTCLHVPDGVIMCVCLCLYAIHIWFDFPIRQDHKYTMESQKERETEKGGGGRTRIRRRRTSRSVRRIPMCLEMCFLVISWNFYLLHIITIIILGPRHTRTHHVGILLILSPFFPQKTRWEGGREVEKRVTYMCWH